MTEQQLTQPERIALLDVVRQWFEAPERVFSLSRPWAREAPVDDLPPTVLTLITDDPADRPQALADARLYHTVGRHRPLFGPEYQVRTRLPHGWDEAGRKTIDDLEVRLAWSWDMPGAQPDHTDLRLKRVRLEAGRWRVAVVYDDEERVGMEQSLALLRERSS